MQAFLETLIHSSASQLIESMSSYSSVFFAVALLPGFLAAVFLAAVFFVLAFLPAFFFLVFAFFVSAAASPSIREAVVTFFLRPTRLGAAFSHSGSEQKYFTLSLLSVRSSSCLPQTGQGFVVGLSHDVKSHSG